MRLMWRRQRGGLLHSLITPSSLASSYRRCCETMLPCISYTIFYSPPPHKIHDISCVCSTQREAVILTRAANSLFNLASVSGRMNYSVQIPSVCVSWVCINPALFVLLSHLALTSPNNKCTSTVNTHGNAAMPVTKHCLRRRGLPKP